MAWLYLDDQFPDHPKVVAAGGDAAWLFVCGLAYCRRYNTEGFIPTAQVARLSDRKSVKKLAAKLVTVRLWREVDDGYQVHDFSDWNRTNSSRSEAGRKAAAARWNRDSADASRNADAMRNAYEPDAPDDALTDAERITDAHASGCTIPNPNPVLTSVQIVTNQTAPVDKPVDNGEPDTAKETEVLAEVRKLVRLKRLPTQVRRALLEDARLAIPDLVTNFPNAPAALLAGAIMGEPANNLNHYRAAR